MSEMELDTVLHGNLHGYNTVPKDSLSLQFHRLALGMIGFLTKIRAPSRKLLRHKWNGRASAFSLETFEPWSPQLGAVQAPAAAHARLTSAENVSTRCTPQCSPYTLYCLWQGFHSQMAEFPSELPLALAFAGPPVDSHSSNKYR